MLPVNLNLPAERLYFLSSKCSRLTLHQYGKTDEMAITLAQSLGQNIGIFSDKKRILNGTQSTMNSSQSTMNGSCIF